MQRLTLLVAVLALALAPALANVWPALGRGPMLYVGDAVSRNPHAGHGEDQGVEGDEHAHHAAASEASADDAHAAHATHCALCVLASLGWAPQVHVGASQAVLALPSRPTPAIAPTLRGDGLRSSVNARAPPAFS